MGANTAEAGPGASQSARNGARAGPGPATHYGRRMEMAVVHLQEGNQRADLPGVEDEGLLDLVARQADTNRGALERVQEARDAAQEDPAVAEPGVRQRAREAVEEVRPAVERAGLEPARDLLEKANTERGRLVAHHLEPDDGGEAMPEEQAREIREHLRGRDPLDVQGILREAALEDRRDLLRAVFGDPLGDVDPILPDDRLEEVRELHLETRFPKQMARIRDRERTADLLAENLRQANAIARRLAGAPLVEDDADDLRVLHGP